MVVLRMKMVAFSIRYNLISGARRLCCDFFFDFARDRNKKCSVESFSSY